MENSIMRNEIKAILVNLFGEPASIIEDKDLFDHGNEQLFHFRYDLDQETFDTNNYENNTEILRERLEVISNRDYIITLEAAFNTNNHFFFVITALK